MKIIEALKEVKRLEEKIKDLNVKIFTFCSDLDIENPVYPDQKGQVNSWLQSVHDTLKEATRLRLAIQQTNLTIKVPIELGTEKVVHSISEWIIRRRLYAKAEMESWANLTDRQLRDGMFKNSSGQDIMVKVRRYYDPLEKDKRIEIYRSEPGIIDRTLEIINATTDLIE